MPSRRSWPDVRAGAEVVIERDAEAVGVISSGHAARLESRHVVEIR
jgi:hypothetical protein